jgi:dihydroorotate dehydrogenase
MKEIYIQVRNKIIGFVYQYALKPIYFTMDPEKIHDRMVKFGRILGGNAISRALTKFCFGYSNKRLEQNVLGINFKNPVGLGAGFDKDAYLTGILGPVGFGFVEVGSITGEPCEGNPKPRLWRLRQSKGLVVYYGLKNEGALKIAQRLKHKKFDIPIGISIAKTNSPQTVEAEAGIADYIKAAKEFVDIGHYFTINISCPNAFGGEPFTDPVKLDKLLTQFDQIQISKPIFLKLSPDLTEHQINAIIEVVERHRVHGFVCTNLTKNRDNNKIKETNLPEKGGISGKVVHDLSVDLVRKIYQKTQGKYVIIGLGGIFNAEDAYRMIKAGASLVQLITGMIFQGPQVISEINQGLVKLMRQDAVDNIKDVIGADHRE